MPTIVLCGFKPVQRLEQYFRPSVLLKGEKLYATRRVYDVKETDGLVVRARCHSQQGKQLYIVSLLVFKFLTTLNQHSCVTTCCEHVPTTAALSFFGNFTHSINRYHMDCSVTRACAFRGVPYSCLTGVLHVQDHLDQPIIDCHHSVTSSKKSIKPLDLVSVVSRLGSGSAGSMPNRFVLGAKLLRAWAVFKFLTTLNQHSCVTTCCEHVPTTAALSFFGNLTPSINRYHMDCSVTRACALRGVPYSCLTGVLHVQDHLDQPIIDCHHSVTSSKKSIKPLDLVSVVSGLGSGSAGSMSNRFVFILQPRKAECNVLEGSCDCSREVESKSIVVKHNPVKYLCSSVEGYHPRESQRKHQYFIPANHF
ncbi:hypothetical protein HPB51_013606 [Rhipicephalus microplus]|uniref:Uncharacterized protein n=1 Tax=Rhipicephalus microplus TaxID=6941 RepID=A0A9J6EGF9_RHIMP|nr:hypothetical protein HPB51_013606 [Rhipicephalus microplus]